MLHTVHQCEEAQEHHQKRGEERPALPLTHDHGTERISQRGRDQQHAQDMQRVGQRGGVFERMRGIHGVETAAIGAQMLDAFKAGDRANDKLLLRAFQRGCHGLGVQRLRHALPDINQRHDEAQRQQQAIENAGEIDPVVADICRCLAAETAHEAAHGAHAGGRADRHQEGDDRHLRKVGEAGFTRIGVPVGVGDKRCGGVEGQIRPLCGARQRVAGDEGLYPQQQVSEQHHRRVAEQQHGAITLPCHAFLGIDAEDTIGAAFQRGVARAGENAGDPFAQNHDQTGHDCQNDDELCEVLCHLRLVQIRLRATMNPAVMRKKRSVTETNTRSPILLPCFSIGVVVCAASEAFGLDQRVEQIGEEARGTEPGQCGHERRHAAGRPRKRQGAAVTATALRASEETGVDDGCGICAAP